jgi:1-acyl-sn-glycerol-3-phosphate acyltransferase
MSTPRPTREPPTHEPPTQRPVPPAAALSVRPVVFPAIEVDRWRAPRFWRFVQFVALLVVPIFCRLRVTGDVPEANRNGPLILAGNHIGTFDPICFTAASARRGVAPRVMATGGLFRAPIVGRLMVAAGHIPVDRGSQTVTRAVPDATSALRAGSVVFIYPEGRIGLDPAMWPERAKTGLARLALTTGAPVVPVATWGSHEVLAYNGRGAMLRTLARSIWHRPIVRVHFGPVVDLSGLREGEVGHAQQASNRIIEAITAALAPLRRDEPRLPRYRDPTKPVSAARLHRSRPLA